VYYSLFMYASFGFIHDLRRTYDCKSTGNLSVNMLYWSRMYLNLSASYSKIT
jgi:hypothetical protein